MTQASRSTNDDMRSTGITLVLLSTALSLEMSTSLLIDIPVEVILDNLFPLIPVPDLLRLGSTNKVCEVVESDQVGI